MSKKTRNQRHDRIRKVPVEKVKELTRPITSIAPRPIPFEVSILNWRKNARLAYVLKHIYKF